MGSFSTLNIAITGMRAAQTGLAVTGHNMANAEINGFARQRSIQSDLRPRAIGTSVTGNALRVGTGVDNQAIHHIRSKYFDLMFRQHNARLNFYATLSAIGNHIETVLGETEGLFRMQNLMSDLWNSMHELNVNITSIEARDMFIGTSINFLNKAQMVFDELFEFQQNLDSQIRNMVGEINDIVAQIHQLNIIIHNNEVTGDNANDQRDERHRLLDRLSGLVPMDYFECHATGRIDILTLHGNFLLHQGSQNVLGLLQISGRYNFVEPVFTTHQGVLPPDTPPGVYQPFFAWDRPINAAAGNDQGALMALLFARGAMPATYRGIEALWDPIALPTTPPPGGFLTVDEIRDAMIGPRLGIVPGSRPTIATVFTPPFTPPLIGPTDPRLLHAQLEWDNQRDQLEALYPLMVTDPPAFIFAVNSTVPGPPNSDFVHMNGVFAAARRTYRQAAWSKEHALVPRVQMYMDRITNAVVNLINQSLAPVLNHTHDPEAPFDMNVPPERSFTEVFVRRIQGNMHLTRFDSNNIHNDGFPGQFDHLYTTRNLMINPLLLQPGGYNYLPLSLSGDPNDTSLILEMIRQWGLEDGNFTVRIGDHYFSIDRAYAVFITDLAIEINESNTYLTSEFLQTSQADQRRNAIMGVSLDEELSGMMTFQFAYQAAARLFNIIDSMIDTLINRTGRVGL